MSVRPFAGVAGADNIYHAIGKGTCSDAGFSPITSQSACSNAAKSFARADDSCAKMEPVPSFQFSKVVNDQTKPAGCYSGCGKNFFLNTHSSAGAASLEFPVLCVQTMADAIEKLAKENSNITDSQKLVLQSQAAANTWQDRSCSALLFMMVDNTTKRATCEDSGAASRKCPAPSTHAPEGTPWTIPPTVAPTMWPKKNRSIPPTKVVVKGSPAMAASYSQWVFASVAFAYYVAALM